MQSEIPTLLALVDGGIRWAIGPSDPRRSSAEDLRARLARLQDEDQPWTCPGQLTIDTEVRSWDDAD